MNNEYSIGENIKTDALLSHNKRTLLSNLKAQKVWLPVLSDWPECTLSYRYITRNED